jgi:hypothetical protein
MKFCWKTCRRDYLGGTDIDGMIIIKWIAKINGLKYWPPSAGRGYRSRAGLL